MADDLPDCNREKQRKEFRKAKSAGVKRTSLVLVAVSTQNFTDGTLSLGLQWVTRRLKVGAGDDVMAKTPAELAAFLDELGIDVTTVNHPPLFTVAQSQDLRGQIAGGHTKNLFLKDKKDNFFLLTVGEEAVVDLKTIHQVIGAASKVSFGKPEKLAELLGVQPGAVTAFGVINDSSNRVRIILDEELMAHDVVNCHPLTNEATTSIRSQDLVRFIEATGHTAQVLKIAS